MCGLMTASICADVGECGRLAYTIMTLWRLIDEFSI